MSAELPRVPDSVRLTDRKHRHGVVGYNVQIAVEAKSHMIVALAAFVDDAERDCYFCPENHELPRQYTGVQKGVPKASYSNPRACAGCPLKLHCTTGDYRKLWRRLNHAVVERAVQRYEKGRELFRQRKSTVEHVYGTLRNRGQGEFLQRGKIKILGELSLSALAYNLTWAINQLGVAALIQAVKV